MRSNKDRPPSAVRQVIGRLIKAPGLLALLWPMALIVGGSIAWQRWGDGRVSQEFVRIDLEQISVTPPPAMIRSPIIETIYRDTAMDQLSLLDRSATAKIASAFSLHPWVRQVSSVRKLPGGNVDVRLQYRTVAAMVKVYKPNEPGHPYYFPVDGDGVLLPTTDFSPAQTIDYIHINVPNAYSMAVVGTPFGDRQVEAAAALAAVLTEYREAAKIESIEVYGDVRKTIVPQLAVRLNDGQSLFWGSPPGQEPPGEANVASKLQWLMSPSRPTDADLRWAGRPTKVR